ncbi:hypothetical protein ACFXMT_35690 [Streptomyces mirabilis]|uniref:hypothetical protein n=1 Tax=Streptomyces mirabilis TaxID=68239 RepID=UPI0036D13CA4
MTAKERQQIVAAIAYARRVGDMAAMPLLLLRLTSPCEARDSYRAQTVCRV